MTVIAKAHELPGGDGTLNAAAWQLYRKPYRRLEDPEAERVWDEIGQAEALLSARGEIERREQ